MEDWERELITKNLPYLIRNTAVNKVMLAIFQSKNILSRFDIERLSDKRTQTEKAYHLYETLLLRVDAFETLKEALLQTNQTEVLQFFLKAEKEDISFKEKGKNTSSVPSPNLEKELVAKRRHSASFDTLCEHEAVNDSESVQSSDAESTDKNIKTPGVKGSRSSLDINAPKFEKCPNDLADMLANPIISFIFIGTMDTLLTVEKIQNTISEMDVKVKKIGIWRQMKIFLSDWKKRACMSGNKMMPLLVLHDSIKEKRNFSVGKIMFKLFGLVKTPINLKIVFVLNKDQSELENYKFTFFGDYDQVGVITDTFSWNGITQNWQEILLSRQIADQGQQRSLKEFCDSHVYEQQDLFRESLMNGKLLVDLIRYIELPVIFRQTIPPVNHYIERKLRTRCYISTTIFKNNSEREVCLFIGFKSLDQWEDVLKGCKGIADTSESQLAQANITANFILLNMSGHFEKVVNKVCLENSIHLINYDDEKLMWIKTVGKQMDLLQNNLCGADFQKEVHECDFFKELKTQSFILQQFKPQVEEVTIIIADSPGMGKSVLLASIAEKTRKFYSSRKDALVFYFVVTDFIAAIQNRHGPKEKLLEFLDTLITEEIVSYCSNYKLDKRILINFVNQSVNAGKNVPKTEVKTHSPPLCMFFDGLDEVTPNNISLALTCFERIKNIFSTVRLHVSTRPQFMQQLEVSLGTLGYYMQPFSTIDQVDFLRKYWSKALYEPKLLPEKLDEYGEQCLKTLKNTFTKEDKDFAGIPLQCLLLAELFEKDAIEYSDPRNRKLIQTMQPTIQVKSIAQLYKKIVDRKLLSFFTRAQVSEHDRLQAESILEQLHCYISIQVIMPSSEWIDKLGMAILNKQTYKQLKNILSNWKCSFSDFHSGMLPRDEILGVGILEATDENRWQFIHRTFAEYFIALLVSKHLNGESYQDKKSFKFKPFVENVILDTNTTTTEVSGLTYTPQPLVQFKYPVICHFVNSLLVQTSQINRTIVDFNPQHLNIIQASICGRFGSILQKYECYLDQQASEEMKALLVLAAQKSSLEIFKLVAKDFLQQFQSILIHVAIKDGNFPVFSYLLTSLPFRNINFSNELLPLLVKDTTLIDHQVVESKTKILTSFLACHPNLISSRNCQRGAIDGALPFMQPNINIKLLKHLVLTSKPEDILEEKDDDFRTILHITAEYLTADDYIELIRTIADLNEDVTPSLLKCRDIFDMTPLHNFIFHQEPSIDLFNVLNKNGADFGTMDEIGYPLLWTAIRQNLKLEHITKLMEIQENKANTKPKDQFNRTHLHIAAQHYKDKSLLQLLLTEGFDVNSEDNFGNTPLFYSLRNFNPSTTNSHIRFLYTKDANILHRNKKGETLIHVAAQLGKVKAIELLFQLGFSLAAFNQKYNSGLTSLTDFKGNTPLYYALRSNYENKWAALKVLVDRFSGDVNQLNSKGESPLHYALQSKNVSFSVETLEYLVPKITSWPEELISLTLACVQKIGEEHLEDNVRNKNLVAAIKKKREL